MRCRHPDRVVPDPSKHEASRCTARTRSKSPRPFEVPQQEEPPEEYDYKDFVRGPSAVPSPQTLAAAAAARQAQQTLAAAAAARQAAMDKQAPSESKMPKRKAELRAAAAENAFADLCRGLPEPPQSAKKSSLRKQKARRDQYKACRFNAGAPYVVHEDAHVAEATHKKSNPSPTPEMLRR